MLLPTFVSYALLLRLAACQFPGPQQVQTNQNGVEVWRAQRFPDDTDVIEYTGKLIYSRGALLIYTKCCSPRPRHDAPNASLQLRQSPLPLPSRRQILWRNRGDRDLSL
jgi:hypothetical protein